MKLTVVIPVYRAEVFLSEAVRSALIQPETLEVILVEGASPDNSLKICRELVRQHSQVRLLQHDGGVNKGAGASRTLGILAADTEFIAFLDADDYYLPDRFGLAENILESDASIDGAYEAIGRHFERETIEEEWFRDNKGRITLTTVTKRVSLEKLFEKQAPIGLYGYTSLDGLVVKRKMLERVGMFDENLRLHQDTAMFVKLAAAARLVAGNLNKPVAMREMVDSYEDYDPKKIRAYCISRFSPSVIINRLDEIYREAISL